MTTLILLWWISLVMCALCLAAVFILLLARAVGTRHTDRRSRERGRLSPLLMQGMVESATKPLARLERKEALILTLELSELVRGPDRDLLLANAEKLGIADTLRRQSRSRNPQDRLIAGEALAMFPDERELAWSLLDDRNPDVRLGTALALAHHKMAPPPADLVRKLGLGTREPSLLGVSLMRDLVEIDPAAVEEMLYDASLPDAAKIAATHALAESGRLELAPLMAMMADLAQDDVAMLPRIYRALGKLGHPSGHRVILKGLDHPDESVRAAAAEAAGRSACTDCAPRLGELLDDEVWTVRYRAGQALYRLGSTGRAILERVGAEENERAALAARTMLAEGEAA